MVSLISFLFAAVLLTLSPGPDIIFVATKSLAQGARAGISVAAGLCSGVFFHTALAAFGVSLIFRQSSLAFNALKIAGTLYLLWLAFQAFRHRNDGIGNAEGEGGRSRFAALYRTGVLMNVLNPKVALFFLALLPQFVPADAPSPWLNMLLLGGIFSVQAFLIFSLVSLCAGKLFSALNTRPSVSKCLNLLTALVLVVIAASLFSL
ncbi:MAG: LysE family translocator [Opitutales bacterium]|nr:LysE family translocator [Opitutales bacterium]